MVGDRQGQRQRQISWCCRIFMLGYAHVGSACGMASVHVGCHGISSSSNGGSSSVGGGSSCRGDVDCASQAVVSPAVATAPEATAMSGQRSSSTCNNSCSCGSSSSRNYENSTSPTKPPLQAAPPRPLPLAATCYSDLPSSRRASAAAWGPPPTRGCTAPARRSTRAVRKQ